MAEKKIDMDELADGLLIDGHRVSVIEWSGDPEKRKEILTRMGAAVFEIAKRDLPTDERKRLINEESQEMVKELAEAGIESTIRTFYGTWPPPPPSEECPPPLSWAGLACPGRLCWSDGGVGLFGRSSRRQRDGLGSYPRVDGARAARRGGLAAGHLPDRRVHR